MRFEVFDLGLVDFRDAWDFQKETHRAVKNHGLASALIVCRHYPVITQGRSASQKNILTSIQELEARRIRVYETERAGDVTYHGPGQITAYPIFNLNNLKKDLNWFLRQLEIAIIGCLSDCNIKSQRRPGLTGVWVGKQKIASIGIAVRNWVTFHGLSINIKKDDLGNFGLIRPCGMDIEMTSLESVLGGPFEIEKAKENIIHKLKTIYN